MVDDEGHPEPEEMDLGQILAALSDPLRRSVVRDLAAQAEDVERTCVSFGLPVSKSTRTHHFKVLREAGLVRQVDRGNSRGVVLRRADITGRYPGLLELVAAEDE